MAQKLVDKIKENKSPGPRISMCPQRVELFNLEVIVLETFQLLTNNLTIVCNLNVGQFHLRNSFFQPL